MFQPAPSVIPLDEALRYKFHWFASRHSEVVGQICEGWRGNGPENIAARIGPVASGAAVVESRAVVGEIVGVPVEMLIWLDVT